MDVRWRERGDVHGSSLEQHPTINLLFNYESKGEI